MIFLKGENVETYWDEFSAPDFLSKYKTVKLVPTKNEVWGKEFFVHDPSGVLWHIRSFNKAL